MEPVEASVTSTLRIIAVLLLIWVVLRLLRNRFGGGNAGKPANWAAPEQRPKGEVRIEKAPPGAIRNEDASKGGPPKGTVSDADFEELK